MSIRIQNDQMTGAASTAAQRNEQSSRPTNGAANAGGGRSIDGEDQVEVSSVASSIGAAVSAQSAARSTRLQQLGALYASGQYSADSFKTSQSIISGALGVTGTRLS